MTKNIFITLLLIVLTIIDCYFNLQTIVIINPIVVTVILLISCFLDGIRDKNMRRICDRNPWHYVKWTSVYLVWGSFLYVSGVSIFPWWLLIAGLSWIFWRQGYKIKLPGFQSKMMNENGVNKEMFPYLF